MYKKIMVPVDLAHVDKMDVALNTAANLSRLYSAPITYVGVTSSAPGPLGHNPAEYGKKLGGFAAAQAEIHGIETDAKAVISHDPAVELDDALVKAVHETDSDLVVMASHIPNVVDHVWPSNGGRLATHTDASVFLVRG
ncbi:universal stress protein [Hoeflea sp. AS60]|uniref:universal stress protein n=1 Tax=Hoeflea sp. AS60 TaxID=3135780 RepID=UPI00317382C7